jgi:hypothetical protein
MLASEQTLMNRWAEIRQRGFIRFVISFGLLRFALPVGVSAQLGAVAFGADLTLKSALSFGAVFLVIGSGYGAMLWRACEKRFLASA